MSSAVCLRTPSYVRMLIVHALTHVRMCILYFCHHRCCVVSGSVAAVGESLSKLQH